MKKLYFAHPMNTYNSTVEKKALKIISSRFPDYEVVNPNGKTHQEACRLTSMEYFKLLVDYSDIVVALPLMDGSWGAGVFYELQIASQRKKKVYEICGVYEKGLIPNIKDLNFFELSPLSVSETRNRMKSDIIR